MTNTEVATVDRIRRIGCIALGALVTIGAVSPTPGAFGSPIPRLTWNKSFQPGQRLRLRSWNGRVRIVRSASRVARLTAYVEQGDAAGLALAARDFGGETTVCAARKGGRSDRCGPRDALSGLTIDLVLQLPRAVDLSVESANGPVSGSGIDNIVDVASNNGDIAISTTRYVRAATRNGNIRVAFGSSRWPGELDLHTRNGNIAVVLPPRTGALVSARTNLGQIYLNDAPVGKSPSANSFERTFGNGRSRLRATSANGDIEVAIAR